LKINPFLIRIMLKNFPASPAALMAPKRAISPAKESRLPKRPKSAIQYIGNILRCIRIFRPEFFNALLKGELPCFFQITGHGGCGPANP
jgi:hypothetical protein